MTYRNHGHDGFTERVRDLFRITAPVPKPTNHDDCGAWILYWQYEGYCQGYRHGRSFWRSLALNLLVWLVILLIGNYVRG
jgi:hypothetical protein